MDDFIKQAKQRFEQLKAKEDQLQKQIAELKAQQRPFKAMLKEVGIIERQSRKKEAPTG